MESWKIKLRKQHSINQKERRRTCFNENRNIINTSVEDNDGPSVANNNKITRKEKLLQFKQQKKLKQELEKQNKQPIFKLSRAPSLFSKNQLPAVVNYNFQNVKSKVNSNLQIKQPQPKIKIIPDNHQFKVPKIIARKTASKTSIPPTSIVTRSQARKQTGSSLDGLSKNVVMKNVAFFNNFSSNVFSSTAIDHFRNEFQMENSKFIFPKDVSVIKSVSPKKLEKNGAYFEQLLDSEIVRLENRCKSWESIVAENSQHIPTEIIDEIDSSIGQSRLLIKKKFEQFRGLTRGNCEKKITSDDLQGFWDMIYMQVENLDKRFVSLENKHRNNWEQKENIIKKPVISKKNDSCIKKNIKVGPSAGLKEAIAAARKKKLALNSTENELDCNNTRTTEVLKEVIGDCTKNIEINKSHSSLTFHTVLETSTNNLATKNISNSVNEDNLVVDRFTRRQAYAKSKQKTVNTSQSSSENETTTEENFMSFNKSSSNARHRMKRGTIYNLLYGKSEKSSIAPPNVIITNESSNDIPTNEFNAGFFTILSPQQNRNTSSTELRTTPKRPSIRKSLLSEKRNPSPGLFMMRASFGAKIAELNTSIEKCSLKSENGS